MGFNSRDSALLTWQRVATLRPNLTGYVGQNVDLMAYVSAVTGDAIVGENRTVDFIDGHGGVLGIVLHGFDDQRAYRLSFVDGGFTHCRDVPLVVGIALFDEQEISAVYVRVRPADLSARDALQRTGFVPAGREHLHDGERVVLRCGLDTIPDHWRRWRRRRTLQEATLCPHPVNGLRLLPTRPLPIPRPSRRRSAAARNLLPRL